MRKVYQFKLDLEFSDRFKEFQKQLKTEEIVHTAVENGVYIVTTEEAKHAGKKLLLERVD